MESHFATVEGNTLVRVGRTRQRITVCVPIPSLPLVIPLSSMLDRTLPAYRWLEQFACGMGNIGAVLSRDSTRVSRLLVRSGFRLGQVTAASVAEFRADYGPLPEGIDAHDTTWIARVIVYVAKTVEEMPVKYEERFDFAVPDFAGDAAVAVDKLARAIAAIEAAYASSSRRQAA